MKRFDALITTQKTSALYKVPYLKKIRKTSKNLNFWKKLYIFLVSTDFSEMGLCRELRFFTLQSEYQNSSFKLSIDPLGSFSLFAIKWGSPFFQTLGRRGSNGVFGEKEKWRVVFYDKRHLKPPGPEKIWISPPLRWLIVCSIPYKLLHSCPILNTPPRYQTIIWYFLTNLFPYCIKYM